MLLSSLLHPGFCQRWLHSWQSNVNSPVTTGLCNPVGLINVATATVSSALPLVDSQRCKLALGWSLCEPKDSRLVMKYRNSNCTCTCHVAVAGEAHSIWNADGGSTGGSELLISVTHTPARHGEALFETLAGQ